MNRILIALVSVMAFTQIAQAQAGYYNEDYRPAGMDRRGCDDQIDEPEVEYMDCDSEDNKYNECWVNGRGVRSIRLYSKNSRSECVANKSFGFKGSVIWVDKGCRATFEIKR
ncbi:DUF3011 domain-containing protein [Bdellovibrio sp. GT3]|uniref:DUF3011 domain-containing protein n=1 Tax=Bdellovibrio sp. GT3 TaxID=3136282 RepID=UPI0030F32B10